MKKLLLSLALLLAIATPARRAISPTLDWTIEKDSNGEFFLTVPGVGQALLVPKLFKGEPVQTMTNAGQFRSAYAVQVEGVAYSAAVVPDPQPRLVYLATSDSGFAGDEGLRVGTSWEDMRSLLGEIELLEETGWACYVCLESGWAAGLLASPGAIGWPGPCQSSIEADSQIAWFFQREATCGN